MEQEILDKIYKRLEALEVVHTRYAGPRGRDGAPAKVCVGKVEVGDTASVKVRQLDGNVFELSFVLPRGQELEALREERAEFREEKNNFRQELYEFRTALSKELQELYERTAAELADVYSKEVFNAVICIEIGNRKTNGSFAAS